MTARLAIGIALLLQTILLFLIVGGVLQDRSGGSHALDLSERDEALDDISQQLLTVTEKLEDIARGLNRPGVPTGDHEVHVQRTGTTPAGGKTSELLAEIDERLGRLQDSLATRTAWDQEMELIQQIRGRFDSANWPAIEALSALGEQDFEQARRSVILLSRSQVIRRFGLPNRLFLGNGFVHWEYDRTVDDDRTEGMTLRFWNGLVADVDDL